MFYHRQLWCRPMRETVCTASMLTSCRRCSHGRPSDQPRPSASPENEETVISERTFREMYPRVQLKAKAQLRRTVARPLMEDPEAHGTTTTSLTTQEEKNQLAEDEEGEEKEDFTAYHNVHPTTQFTQDTADHTTQSGPEAFLEEVQRQTEELRYRRNQAIPYPDHPDLSAPEFRRIKRSAKNEVIDEEKLSDEDVPKFERRDIHVALPPPVLLHNKMYSFTVNEKNNLPNSFFRDNPIFNKDRRRMHPWVETAPIGPHIVHGDGLIEVYGGTGEVGFDDYNLHQRWKEEKEKRQRAMGSIAPKPPKAVVEDEEESARHKAVAHINKEALPEYFRGLQHRSVLNHKLSQRHGKVLQDAVVKNSFALTGRGVFATRDVKKGETIMIVESTAQNVGAKGEFRRLEEMVVEILREVLDEEDPGRREGALDYLHHWILTGQPSSLLEHWPKQSTDRVIAAIGGEAQLLHLELHPIHIARLAAILDLNSFLVESYYANRKGMAYFPEAGYLNHSCEPNCDYEIMPAHVFPESDYYLDEFVERDRRREEGEEKDVVTTEGEKDVVTSYGDTPLTEEDAPRYLFCCRANQDIKSGEQILIAYVPPTWTFDQRQEVLHDRYRFWCKCPKCSPTLDSRYGKGARFLMALLALAIVLQVFMVYTRDKQHDVDKELEQLRRMTPEERREELIRRGFDVDDLTPEGWKKRQASRKGLFEELEDKKLMDLSFENARIDLFPDEMKKELYEMERRKNRY